MENIDSDFQLEKVGKRNFAGDSNDRLSNLPDSILYYIISFLDIKSAVQTTVLSRRWRCVWKHLPVLHMDLDSFEEVGSNFEAFMDKVLTLRYPLSVDKISFSESNNDHDSDLLHRIIDYGVSHHAQHIDVFLCCSDDDIVKFSALFDSFLNLDVKTMHLQSVLFDVGSYCFQTLTSLKLTCCLFDLEEGYLDCSLSLPCLMSLVMMDCSGGDKGIKVFAPRLLKLKLFGNEDDSMEIIAPKLEFFSLDVWYCDGEEYLGVPKFTLPYVHHVDITVSDGHWLHKERLVTLLDDFFPALHNAKSLLLRCQTIEALQWICKFLEQKPLPFIRLESLVCKCDESHEVVNYLVERSSCGGPNLKHFRRQFSTPLL